MRMPYGTGEMGGLPLPYSSATSLYGDRPWATRPGLVCPTEAVFICRGWLAEVINPIAMPSHPLRRSETPQPAPMSL